MYKLHISYFRRIVWIFLKWIILLFFLHHAQPDSPVRFRSYIRLEKVTSEGLVLSSTPPTYTCQVFQTTGLTCKYSSLKHSCSENKWRLFSLLRDKTCSPDMETHVLSLTHYLPKNNYLHIKSIYITIYKILGSEFVKFKVSRKPLLSFQ